MLNVGKYAVRPMGRIWACNWGSTEGNAAAQTEVGGCEGTLTEDSRYLSSLGTLPKFNIAPEKLPGPNRNVFCPTIIFQGLC